MPIKNCSQLRKRQLLAAARDLNCSAVRVTLAAQSHTQAMLIQQKLQGAGALSELGTCLETQLASIGPIGMCPPSQLLTIVNLRFNWHGY